MTIRINDHLVTGIIAADWLSEPGVCLFTVDRRLPEYDADFRYAQEVMGGEYFTYGVPLCS